MRTVRLKVYKFSELSQEAKEKAMEKFVQDDDFEFSLFSDSAVEQLKELGFSEPKIRYNLSYSQGDGFSFDADGYKKLPDLFKKYLGTGKDKLIGIIINNCDLSIKQSGSHHYAFPSKGDIDLTVNNYTRNYPNVEELVSKVLADLEDLYIETCKDLEKDGYAELEYRTTEEFIAEEYAVNGTEFTIDGEPFYS